MPHLTGLTDGPFADHPRTWLVSALGFGHSVDLAESAHTSADCNAFGRTLLVFLLALAFTDSKPAVSLVAFPCRGWTTARHAGRPVSGMGVAMGMSPQPDFAPRSNLDGALLVPRLDLALMPACRPVVELSRTWLVGEAVALVLVLVPAALFSRWTADNTQLEYRSLLWAVTASSLLLFFVPEIFFASSGHGGWQALFHRTGSIRNLQLQVISLLAVPAFSAVQEFTRRGHGTPIPYDPPQCLVISGLYRYIANPMQTSAVLVFSAWALLLRDPWLLMGGFTIVIYCVGLAAWHEDQDMKERLGEPWLRYRANVANWIPRWRPWHDPETILPRLYIAENCSQCSQVRHWLEVRNPSGLEIAAAEDHPTHNLYRMTYDPMDNTRPDEGVAAFARGLEHLNLGWAFVGALLRLPIICSVHNFCSMLRGLGHN